MRQYHRIQKQFYRICLVSERDSETLALVPDIENAYMIVQLLQASQRLREGQRIVSFPSVLRPEPDPDEGQEESIVTITATTDLT
ncbi:MAG: hypothetical protein WC216_09100 [Gallionella sp.]|jgi:hypothetical protein